MKWLFNDWVLSALIVAALVLLLFHSHQPIHAQDWGDGFSYGVMFLPRLASHL